MSLLPLQHVFLSLEPSDREFSFAAIFPPGYAEHEIAAQAENMNLRVTSPLVDRAPVKDFRRGEGPGTVPLETALSP